MPFTLTVLLLAVLVSVLRGGRLQRIANAPIRWSGLLFLGLAVQLGVELAARQRLIVDAEAALTVALVGSQVLVLVWVLRNWHLPGMLLISTGLALNATVIAANGGMPVDPAAIDALGLEGTRIPVGKHTLLTDETVLPWLGDLFAIPPLRSIVSIGDLVLAAGLLPLTHALMSYRPAQERRRTALSRHRAEQRREARAALAGDVEEPESPLFDDHDPDPAEPTDAEPDDPTDDEPTDDAQADETHDAGADETQADETQTDERR